MITYGDIPPRVGIQAESRLLRVGLPLLTTQRFGQADDAKRRAGNTIKWRRYHAFTVSTAPIAEGIPPAVQPLHKSDYTAILQQYGAVSEMTDVCHDLHEDNVLDVLVKRSGEQMAQTIEAVTIETLKSGTTVFYASGVASRALVNAAPSLADFRKIARYFDRNDGMPISEIVMPTPKVSTQGVEEAYYVLGHTDLDSDIRNLTGFVNYAEYGDPAKRLPGEIGACERFRFILTRMFTPWEVAGASGTTFLSGGAAVTSSAAADVYPLICLARDAYGCVRLGNRGSVEIKVLQPKTPRGGDPLGQKGTVGWITYYACAILNEDWVARLECAATANPS